MKILKKITTSFTLLISLLINSSHKIGYAVFFNAIDKNEPHLLEKT